MGLEGAEGGSSRPDLHKMRRKLFFIKRFRVPLTFFPLRTKVINLILSRSF